MLQSQDTIEQCSACLLVKIFYSISYNFFNSCALVHRPPQYIVLLSFFTGGQYVAFSPRYCERYKMNGHGVNKNSPCNLAQREGQRRAIA